MHHSKTIAALILTGAFIGSFFVAGAAFAAGFDDSSSYNGLNSQMNSPANAQLRDANGNLTLVNGQFTSANFSQNTGAQTASAGGVGMGGAGTTSATATAIGNSLNVTTIGFDNTVVVNSTQTNSGNQTASVKINGH